VLVDGNPITGATAWTFQVPPECAGHRLSFALTATAPGYDEKLLRQPNKKFFLGS